MNEQLKELAEQAGISIDKYGLAFDSDDPTNGIDIELFFDLVEQWARADERDKCAQDYLQDCADAVEAARIEEREACADLCDTKAHQSDSDDEAGGMYWCADEIRRRGENNV